MVVNDIETGGSHLARIFDSDSAAEYEHQQQQQHHIRHGQLANHHHHRHHHNTQHGHQNLNHRQQPQPQQQHQQQHQRLAESHNVDAGNHNDVEIGHTQPNMVNVVINTLFIEHFAYIHNELLVPLVE